MNDQTQNSDKPANNNTDNEFCNDLNPKKKRDVKKSVERNLSFNTKQANQYNSKIYGWLLLLNAGGLIGTITLLSTKPKTIDYVICCIIMIIFFLLGIMLIFCAAHFEIERAQKNKERIVNAYSQFIKNKLSLDLLKSTISKDDYPIEITKKVEYLSFSFFICGVLLGVLFSIFNPEELCSSKSNEDMSQSSCSIPYKCFASEKDIQLIKLNL